MRILAVDYGDARTGIAVSDNSEFLASPVETVTEYDAQRLARRIGEIAKEQGAGEIVVGLPVNMNGTYGPRAEKCREFGDMLADVTGLPVTMWDERSTTVTAHQVLNTVNVRGKKRKAVVDTVAAVVILESYLSYRKARRNREKSEN
ncbi:MAG: Holliday junction resolvase RuvX [Ruminococcus sp.]|nr:Holliday junction resolvase RuvX [Ruminococcus sp.]